MSFTKTQLIHRLSQSPPRTAQTGFILSKGIGESEDTGLIMKMDQKLIGDSVGTVRTTASPQKFCGEASLSGFLSCLQYAHISFVTFTNNVNKAVQNKAVRVMPVCLYMSLLVLAIQGIVLTALLTQSCLPMGIWFLIACIGALGGIYCFTSEVTENTVSPAKEKNYL